MQQAYRARRSTREWRPALSAAPRSRSGRTCTRGAAAFEIGRPARAAAARVSEVPCRQKCDDLILQKPFGVGFAARELPAAGWRACSRGRPRCADAGASWSGPRGKPSLTGMFTQCLRMASVPWPKRRDMLRDKRQNTSRRRQSSSTSFVFLPKRLGKSKRGSRGTASRHYGPRCKTQCPQIAASI